jgi:hypothetical protein
MRHAGDYSENSSSGIAEYGLVAVHYGKNSGSGIAEYGLVAMHYGKNSGSGIAQLRTSGWLRNTEKLR